MISRLPPLVLNGKRVQMKAVEAADRFFRDRYADDAVDPYRCPF